MICQLCQKDCGSLKQLTAHIAAHGIISKEYYDKFLKKENEGMCLVCSTPTKYKNMNVGYNEHCCIKCGNITGGLRQWSGEQGKLRKVDQKVKFEQYSNKDGRPKGSKNKNPYPESEAVLQRYKNHPPPSWKGRHHTEKTKEIKSKIMSAYIEKNGIKMSYKGKFKPKNPSKYKGDTTNIVYRSLWERDFMKWLDETSSVLFWQSEEFFIPYYDPTSNKQRRYFPDFLIQVATKNGPETWLIEIKPYKQTHLPKKPKRQTKRYLQEVATFAVNDAKWKSAAQFCKENNMKWKVLTEKDLYAMK